MGGGWLGRVKKMKKRTLCIFGSLVSLYLSICNNVGWVPPHLLHSTKTLGCIPIGG